VVFLQNADTSLRRPVLSYIAQQGEADLVANLVLCAWPGADDALRSDLAALVRELLENMCGGGYCSSCEAFHPGDLESYADLDARGRRIWERLEPVVLSAHPLFLHLALGRATSPAHAKQVFERYLEGDVPIERWVEAIGAARERHRQLWSSLRERMVAHFGENAEALARGLLRAVSGERATGAIVALSNALIEATGRGPKLLSERVERALVVAKRYARRRPQRRASRAGAAPAIERAKEPSRDRQQELFSEGSHDGS